MNPPPRPEKIPGRGVTDLSDAQKREVAKVLASHKEAARAFDTVVTSDAADEVATLLGISRANVKIRAFRARKVLRAVLETTISER
ncbi:MAG: hypothetical protein ACOY4F_09150 [Thermodesulfobacteriota bacterium]